MLAHNPTNVDSFTNKWNTFVVNLNGIKPGFRNGIKNGITATVTPRDHTNTISTPMSPPYIVAPSFEMRWPIKNGHNSTQIPVSNSHSEISWAFYFYMKSILQNLESEKLQFGQFLNTIDYAFDDIWQV